MEYRVFILFTCERDSEGALTIKHSPWRKLLMKADRTDKGSLWEWLQASKIRRIQERGTPQSTSNVIIRDRIQRFSSTPSLQFLVEVDSLKVTHLIYALFHQTAMPQGQRTGSTRLLINVSRTFRIQSPHWQLPLRSLSSKEACLVGPSLKSQRGGYQQGEGWLQDGVRENACQGFRAYSNSI